MPSRHMRSSTQLRAGRELTSPLLFSTKFGRALRFLQDSRSRCSLALVWQEWKAITEYVLRFVGRYLNQALYEAIE
jgi:hypothetical protein